MRYLRTMKNSNYLDVIADIYFYPTERGGRNGHLPLNQYRCPMVINEEMFDCVLLLPKDKLINPGDTVRVSMEFLSPQIVLPMLSVGKKFQLWESGIKAEGEVISLEDKKDIEQI